jgi:hypothetical protein
MKNKAAVEHAAKVVVAPDSHTGKGGSYMRDPQTGMRVPSKETQEFHKTEGKVSDEQEKS